LAAPLAATVGIGAGRLVAGARAGGRPPAFGLAGLLVGTVAYAAGSAAFLPRGGPVPGLDFRPPPAVVQAVEGYVAANREPGAALDLAAMHSAAVEPFLVDGFLAAAL